MWLLEFTCPHLLLLIDRRFVVTGVIGRNQEFLFWENNVGGKLVSGNKVNKGNEIVNSPPIKLILFIFSLSLHPPELLWHSIAMTSGCPNGMQLDLWQSILA